MLVNAYADNNLSGSHVDCGFCGCGFCGVNVSGGGARAVTSAAHREPAEEGFKEEGK
jgi:aerobic-type carbon monoxide dehydrogenase small subunit (CoxS/CutS family)